MYHLANLTNGDKNSVQMRSCRESLVQNQRWGSTNCGWMGNEQKWRGGDGPCISKKLDNDESVEVRTAGQGTSLNKK